jgi:hypothetical protein
MVRKTLTYSSFAVASLLVILAFVTAKTYTQLGIAVLVYPLLAYFAYKLFVDKGKAPVVTVQLPLTKPAKKVKIEKAEPESKKGGITDGDKRDFLKMIGAAGISFFLYSIFSKRAEPLFFGRSAESEGTLKDSTGNKINPAERQPTDSYRISEIDDNFVSFYGFTNKDGAWYIMKEDPDDGSFRYSKGNSNFSGSWVNRDSLDYDYFHKVF